VYAAKGNPRYSINTVMSEYAEYLKKHVGDTLGAFVEPGGYRKEFTAELWIISRHDDNWAEATPDEFFEPEKFQEVGELTDDEFISVLCAFMQKSYSEPTFQGYIINYGTTKEIANREKLIVENISSRKHDRSRLTLVNGGPRQSQLTMFWHVPPGGKSPAP
jgi:hypothetical protein